MVVAGRVKVKSVVVGGLVVVDDETSAAVTCLRPCDPANQASSAVPMVVPEEIIFLSARLSTVSKVVKLPAPVDQPYPEPGTVNAPEPLKPNEMLPPAQNTPIVVAN